MKYDKLSKRAIITTIAVAIIFATAQGFLMFRVEKSKQTAAVYEICAIANEISYDLKSYAIEGATGGTIYADLRMLDESYNAYSNSLRRWNGFKTVSFFTGNSNIRYFADRFLIYQTEKSKSGEFSSGAMEHMTAAQVSLRSFAMLCL